MRPFETAASRPPQGEGGSTQYPGAPIEEAMVAVLESPQRIARLTPVADVFAAIDRLVAAGGAVAPRRRRRGRPDAGGRPHRRRPASPDRHRPARWLGAGERGDERCRLLCAGDPDAPSRAPRNRRRIAGRRRRSRRARRRAGTIEQVGGARRRRAGRGRACAGNRRRAGRSLAARRPGAAAQRPGGAAGLGTWRGVRAPTAHPSRRRARGSDPRHGGRLSRRHGGGRWRRGRCGGVRGRPRRRADARRRRPDRHRRRHRNGRARSQRRRRWRASGRSSVTASRWRRARPPHSDGSGRRRCCSFPAASTPRSPPG